MVGKLKTFVLDSADIKGLASFYGELTGFTQTYADDEWITMTGPDGIRFGFQLAPDHTPPRWPDPAYPQQFHLDLLVPDIDAAAERAEKLGATRLASGESWHTIADPSGHTIDLCRGDKPETGLYAVTVDVPDAKQAATFYAALLGMERRYDGDEGSLIGVDGQMSVMFQPVAVYTAPRWPDPAYPQQAHLDVHVDDIDAAEPQALALGATQLPGGGDNWRVYADPAGHPFCLTW